MMASSFRHVGISVARRSFGSVAERCNLLSSMSSSSSIHRPAVTVFALQQSPAFGMAQLPIMTTPSTMTMRYFSSQNSMSSDSAGNAQSSSSSSKMTPLGEDLNRMTNEQLMETSNIPGWDLIHAPPRKFPRGAMVGRVVSTKMQKTVNVAVERYRIVPKIRKRTKLTRKFMAHDEGEVANLGDVVMIVPCHRISKNKHFMLHEIIRARA